MISSSTELERVVVDQINPEKLVPGGTDTCIHDLFKYAAANSLALVGITDNPEMRLGNWVKIQFASNEVDFLPVARFDRNRNSGFRIPHSFRLALGLARYSSKIPRVAVQAHRIEIGAVLKVLGKSPMIQFIHNDSRGLTGENSDSLWKWLSPLYRKLEDVVFKGASNVVLFNKTDSDRIRRRVENLSVVETWFDPEVFKLGREPWDGGAIEVCWIGRFEAQKDPILAVDTVAALSLLYPKFRLTMVGTGSLEQDIVQAAENHGISNQLRLTGALSRHEVAEVMRSSTVMLLTSHYEGSPRVVAEAAATGLPIVATEEADTDRVLDTGVNGERVVGRSASELAAAIVAAASYLPNNCADAVRHREAPRAIQKLLERSRAVRS
jgi:glycosyltransferase involved in cell wall biosynthesis